MDKIISLLSIEENVSYSKKEEVKESSVIMYLKDIGILEHIKGYSYLKEAILHLEEGEKMMSVYDRVAKKYGISIRKVERAIRYAIERAWTGTKYLEFIEDIFGNTILWDKGKPTNMQFVITSANYIKNNSKYKV